MTAGAHLAALQPFSVDRMPAELSGGVVAIGNFDGVHSGHAVLLAAARAEAARGSRPALVLTFEPHPRTVLRPEIPVFRLTPLRAKARLLKALGMDGMAVATFDRAFAAMTPSEFVERVLVERLRIAAAVVGFSFHFGQGRQGTPATLTDLGKKAGFAAVVVDPVTGPSGAPVASSAIRDALTQGDVAGANRALGYRWFVVGTVEHGDARGRDLGFPTANLRLAPDCRLRHGIYAVRLTRRGGVIHDGVASFGVRPTFGGGLPLLEVNVFDFADDLYGEEVAVTFVDWLRPEAKFSGVPDLIAAIRADVATARTRLAAAAPGSERDGQLGALP